MYPDSDQITEYRYKQIPEKAGEILYEENSGNYILLLCQKKNECPKPWVFVKGDINNCGVFPLKWIQGIQREILMCYEDKINVGCVFSPRFEKVYSKAKVTLKHSINFYENLFFNN